MNSPGNISTVNFCLALANIVERNNLGCKSCTICRPIAPYVIRSAIEKGSCSLRVFFHRPGVGGTTVELIPPFYRILNSNFNSAIRGINIYRISNITVRTLHGYVCHIQRMLQLCICSFTIRNPVFKYHNFDSCGKIVVRCPLNAIFANIMPLIGYLFPKCGLCNRDIGLRFYVRSLHSSFVFHTLGRDALLQLTLENQPVQSALFTIIQCISTFQLSQSSHVNLLCSFIDCNRCIIRSILKRIIKTCFLYYNTFKFSSNNFYFPCDGLTIFAQRSTLIDCYRKNGNIRLVLNRCTLITRSGYFIGINCC